MAEKLGMRDSTVVIALACIAAVGCNSKGESPVIQAPVEPPAKVATMAAEPAVTDGAVVYYFHGDRRCTTCLGIQAGIEKTVAEKFSAERDAGTLVFREINIEDDAGKPYADKYQLASSTMIVSSVKAGKEVSWKSCDDVWLHALDEPKLMAYVEAQIRSGLVAAGK